AHRDLHSFPTRRSSDLEPFGDRGLAHTRFTHQQRIVLAPAAQHLNDPFELDLASDQRIDLAALRHMVEVYRVRFERAGGLLFARSEEHTSELQSRSDLV